MAGPICTKFSGKVWSDHGTTWLNFGSVRVNGAVGQRSICLLSKLLPVELDISFALATWQQGVGFVVPRTTACSISTMNNIYASAQLTVTEGTLFLSCSSVRPSVCPKTLLTWYPAEYLTHFLQLTSMMHYVTRHSLGSKGQRSRSWWNKVCWKQHFLSC